MKFSAKYQQPLAQTGRARQGLTSDGVEREGGLLNGITVTWWPVCQAISWTVLTDRDSYGFLHTTISHPAVCTAVLQLCIILIKCECITLCVPCVPGHFRFHFKYSGASTGWVAGVW